MPLVEVRDLYISFDIRPAVDGISFSIDAGDRLGLIGESGSGKTLTALALAGLLPDAARMSGEITFDGEPLPKADAAMAHLRGNHIGFVFQEPMSALNPLMRAGDQIAEAARLHFKGKAVLDRVAELLAETGLLAGHARRYPHELSGGQRQRVMIAMALAGKPQLIICDEPTSALDVLTQRRILALLDKIAKARNAALLFISHDLRAVAQICDRLAIMKSGRLVETGSRDALLGKPQSAYAKKLVAAAANKVRPARDMTTRRPLVSAMGIGRTFRPPFGWLGAGTPTVALSDVTFDLLAGEAVALIGPSGSGKTTLARLIAGLDHPTSGELRLDGVQYGGKARLPAELRRDISLVFQDPAASFDPRLTVGQSLAEPMRLLSELSPQQRRHRLAESIEAVELPTDILSRLPHEFSGGQRQRLAIARALVTRPRLVILDEPVSALDLSLRASVLGLLNRLRANFGLTYLAITHDFDMAEAIADRVIVLDEGKIIEEGRLSKVLAAPKAQLTKDLLDARLPALKQVS